MAALSRSVLLGRALRLVCPRCGVDKMFSGLFHMHERCGHCGFKYEREPGYFLGSIYINYGLTAVTSTIVYVILRFGFEFDGWLILWPLLVFCIIFPVFFFRYARAYWLAMDCYFDNDFSSEEGPSDSGDPQPFPVAKDPDGRSDVDGPEAKL